MSSLGGLWDLQQQAIANTANSNQSNTAMSRMSVNNSLIASAGNAMNQMTGQNMGGQSGPAGGGSYTNSQYGYGGVGSSPLTTNTDVFGTNYSQAQDMYNALAGNTAQRINLAGQNAQLQYDTALQRKNQQAGAFQMLQQYLQGGGAGGADAWGQIQGLRQSNYAPGSLGRVGTAQMQDYAAGPDSSSWNAMRNTAQAGLNQQYQTALRNSQGLNQRGVPAMTSNARMSDLITARLNSQAGVEQGLQAQQAQNQYQALQSIMNAQAANANIASTEAQGRVGNVDQFYGNQQQFQNQLLSSLFNYATQ